MRVLVTGGTGYVGARIVADLARAGHDVRLLVRRPEQVRTSLAPYDGVGYLVAAELVLSRAVAEGFDPRSTPGVSTGPTTPTGV